MAGPSVLKQAPGIASPTQALPELSNESAQPVVSSGETPSYSKATKLPEAPVFKPLGLYSYSPPAISLREVPSTSQVNQCSEMDEISLTDPEHQALGLHLHTMLDALDYTSAYQVMLGQDYLTKPLEDAHIYREGLQANPEFAKLQSKQQLALQLFSLGGILSGEAVLFLFEQEPDLLTALLDNHVMVAINSDGQLFYRLNELSLMARRLPNDEVIYLFADAPKEFDVICNQSRSAILSETSFILLNYLEGLYKSGSSYEGLGADMGAGVGIQAIAMLKLFPKVEKIYAAEIDAHGMNLNRFNALLNGVGERIAVVDNQDLGELGRTLNGRPLDFAVSNPPFNAVPHEFSAFFTDFGDGGDRGLDITELFINQLLPLLKGQAPIIFYSVLTQDQSWEYHATGLLRDKPQAASVEYKQLDLAIFDLDLEMYAKVLTLYLQSQIPAKPGEIKLIQAYGTEPSVDSELLGKIQAGLVQSGIARLKSAIWIVRKGDRAGSDLKVQSSNEAIPAYQADPFSKGGVFGMGQQKGGAYIRTHIMPRGGAYERLQEQGGVYIQEQEIK